MNIELLPPRFRSKFTMSTETECWEWTACKNKDGYGLFWWQGKPRAAHQVAYIILVGTVPEGNELDHLCRVRWCVNPLHLKPKTHQANMLCGETLAAMNAVKTHCKRGHEFTPENTYLYPNGKRACRTCDRDSHVARYQSRKSESGE